MSTRLAVILTANFVAVVSLFYAAGFIPVVAHRTDPPMLLIAHRGDMANHPENTLESFAAAAKLGADGIEMDVWRSSSGTWWVIHDSTVDRTTASTGPVRALTDRELSELRIDGGLGFSATDADQHRIPRLEDALRLLGSYDGWLYIHLKEPARDAAVLLGETLERHDATSRTTVIVPSRASASYIKVASPDARTIVLQDGLGMPPTHADVDGWLTMESRIIRPGLVSGRPYAVEVYANGDDGPWDETDSLRRASRFNVRAYITNDVARAMETLRTDGWRR